MHRRWGLLWFALSTALLVGQEAAPAAPPCNGRIERHGELRVLRVWGTPEERGRAHGLLLGKEIAAVATAEFTSRFAERPGLLEMARSALGRAIVYPDDVTAELTALFAGVQESGADLRMPEFGRDLDLRDLMVANGLDVFALMGCSSFTLWGDQVEGSGVLTGRNFDWPLTGDHMLDATLLIVQHFADGRAVASVGWPGYVGSVTGVNDDGVVAYLHVGSAKIVYTPEPDSWPTAIAARGVLARARAADGAAAFATARELLDYTSPPAGFLTHLVLPRAPEGGPPFAVFETDARTVVVAEAGTGPCVLTNHFRTRTDGRGASRDSLDREKRVQAGIATCFESGDERVSVEEAWDLLRSVASGSRRFGTLHSLVFRLDPWCFELRIAGLADGKVVPAPDSERAHSLTREQVFGDGAPR